MVVVVVVVTVVEGGLTVVPALVLAGPGVEDSPLHADEKRASAIAMTVKRISPRYKASTFAELSSSRLIT